MKYTGRIIKINEYDNSVEVLVVLPKGGIKLTLGNCELTQK